MSGAADAFGLSLERAVADGAEAAVLRVSGEVDLAVADELETALRGAADSEAAVILDLRDVTFADSSGLRVMLLGADELGARLVFLLDEGSALTRLLELAEVSDRLEIFASERDAVLAIAAAGPEGND
jgi:anti-sigma B factor antagonist